ncbi:MAG: AraC family transcriptional regulator, partial [Victivallaceae bacterium]|nr:AraC family transcriptional regulator [Victivallaceae bacterium]
SIVNCGFGEKIFSWPSNPDYASDPFFRIYLPVEGAFRIGTQNGALEISPGGLYLIPMMTPLKYVPVSPCSHYWLHFYSNRLRRVFPPDQLYSCACRRPERFVKRFHTLFRLLEGADTVAAAVKIRHQLESLVIPFLNRKPVENPVKNNDERIEYVVKYIAEHLYEPILLSTLSRKVNMSSSHFQEVFRKQQGETPKRYIVTRRLSEARKLLLCTKMHIGEIASSCGYENVYFFCRQFKKYLDCTPTEYRIIHTAPSYSNPDQE